MVRIVGEPLDLSQLPPLQLVAVDAEAELASLMAGITARYRARDIAYNVGAIEGDTVVVQAEEFAYRKTLLLQALNDAANRLTLAKGDGASLDHIAATYYADVGVRRLPLVADPRPYVTNPEDWEGDDRFKRRIQLAPETRTPGTLRGYEYFALTAAPHLIDARAFNYASGLCSPGQIVVVVLGKDPDPDPLVDKPEEDEAAQLVLAQNALLNRNTKLGSDEVMVRVARRVTATSAAVLGIPSGPDPALIVATGLPGLAAYIAEAGSKIGEIFSLSSQMAKLTVSGVRRVRLLSPATDIDPGPDGVVKATVGAVTTELVSV